MRRCFSVLLRTFLPVAALLLHVAVVLCYARRWDKLAAITVFPFWAWGLLGLGMAGLSWLIYRGRFRLAVSALWLVTILLGSDETRPLLRMTAGKPEPGRAAPGTNGRPVIRAITFNCRAGHFNPHAVDEVIPWDPDIVLLQETAHLATLESLAKKLYPGPPSDHAVGGWECGIVTRGKILRRLEGHYPHTLIATIQMQDGSLIQVASVHLQGAETDIRLYSREALWKHAQNRVSRRLELQRLLSVQELMRGGKPALIGGDFNAPAGDAIFRLLESASYQDAFAMAGSGWPDTYPNWAPMLRIDHQWVNSRLTPIRGRVVRSALSDHRMVVCDYLVD